MLFESTSRVVARTRFVGPRRTFSTSRQSGSNAHKHVQGVVSSFPVNKYWQLAAGATVSIASAAYIFFSPSRQPPKESHSSASTTKKNAPGRGDETDQRGLQPNTEPARKDQDASKTTGANTEKGNTVQNIPDAKGGAKKRVTSQAGMKQGTADKSPSKGYEGVQDKVAASKPPGGLGTTSAKQEGLTNTDTKYSIDLTNTSQKSVKGEGTPETSKSKGTVDSRRPLAP